MSTYFAQSLITLLLLISFHNLIPFCNSEGGQTRGRGKVSSWSSGAYNFEVPRDSTQCFSLKKENAYDPGHNGQEEGTARILHPGSNVKYNLNIILPESCYCFKIFESDDCNQQQEGMYLEFRNVKGGNQMLKLQSPSIGAPTGEQRLLNFDMYACSVQLCDEHDKQKLQMDHCQSKFSVETISQHTKTTIGDINQCQNLFQPRQAKESPPFRTGAELNILRDYPKNNGTVCLEVFSQNDCMGDNVRVIIPAACSVKDSSCWKWKDGIIFTKLWDYMPDENNIPLVDTDIRSVRKCSYCLKPALDQDSLSDYSKPKVPSEPEGAVPVASQHNQEICHSKCLPISNFTKDPSQNLNTGNTCYLYFNVSSCSEQPILKDKPVDTNMLRKIVKDYPEFKSWSASECDGPKLNSPNCKQVTPISNQTLGEFFPAKKKSSSSSSTPPWEIIVLSVAGTLSLLMLIAVFIMAFLLWRKKRKIRAIRQVRYFNSQQQQQRIHQAEAIEENDYVNDVTGLRAMCASFANGYEIPRENINIGSMRDNTACIIGMGEFSVAFKGRLEPNGRTVAVKTLKSGQATTRSVKGALRECQIFVQLGKHPGILEFLGVCTENARQGEVFMVTKWCEKGSLRGFLVQYKNNFVSLVQDGEWVIDEKLKAALDSKSCVESGPPTKFNTVQLFRWCLEVADAMEFLAVRKIVHTSLSARNVLLDEKFVCKISDFHSAKVPGDLVPSGSFSTMNMIGVNKERLVPWRWQAVESLLDDVFTTQSDVWTFGVFMWEVFSLGATPYLDYSYGSEFQLCIKHGYRLQAPNFTTVECYQLMLMCWFDGPEKRPSFTKLKAKLDEMTPKRNKPIAPGPFQVVRSLSKTSVLK